jgi:hypothetical protein
MGCKIVRERNDPPRPRSEKFVSFDDRVTAIPGVEFSEPPSRAGSQNESRSGASCEDPPADRTKSAEIMRDTEQVDNSQLENIGRSKGVTVRRKSSSVMTAVSRSRKKEQPDAAQSDEEKRTVEE